jgi:hypothetical protein
MKQTAVEWLVKEFNLEKWEAAVNFAKSMEEQQHFETWDNGMDRMSLLDENNPRTYYDFAEYYNETYGGNK